MSYHLVIEDVALEEAISARNWYNTQKNGLGNEFVDALEDIFNYIIKFPEACNKVFGQQRQAVLKRFPYVVLYKIEGNNLVVYAIFHTSQNPVKKFRRKRKN